MNQAGKQEIRANLLFAFAPALADAITKEPWEATKIAKAFQEAIDVLVPDDDLITIRVTQAYIDRAAAAEYVSECLNAGSVPTHSKDGQKYSLWGRVQVFAGVNTSEALYEDIQPNLSNMVPWQQRVVVEAAELEHKLKNLYAYIETDGYKSLRMVEQISLRTQAYYMKVYCQTLEHRIARFTNEV